MLIFFTEFSEYLDVDFIANEALGLYLTNEDLLKSAEYVDEVLNASDSYGQQEYYDPQHSTINDNISSPMCDSSSNSWNESYSNFSGIQPSDSYSYEDFDCFRNVLNSPKNSGN